MVVRCYIGCYHMLWATTCVDLRQMGSPHPNRTTRPGRRRSSGGNWSLASKSPVRHLIPSVSLTLNIVQSGMPSGAPRNALKRMTHPWLRFEARAAFIRLQWRHACGFPVTQRPYPVSGDVLPLTASLPSAASGAGSMPGSYSPPYCHCDPTSALPSMYDQPRLQWSSTPANASH